MADASQYSFNLKEVTTALVKQQNLREGRWFVAFEFNLSAGNAGPGPNDLRPSAIVSINGMLLVRVRDGEPDLPFQVDAAQVNPA